MNFVVSNWIGNQKIILPETLMNLKVVGLIMFVIGASESLAQVELQKITPLSPNAAAIAKYGEVPVSHFTGVPNISIPIYTVQSKSLTLPITLSYHAGGNRVETIASWVGMGWSLSPQPTISRIVRGIPDEDPGGFYNKYNGKTVKQIYTNWLEDPTGTNGSNMTNLLGQSREGNADTEADLFTYSIAGKSGQFYFDQESMSFRTTPHENFQITYNESGHFFTIVTDDGTRYIFGTKDKINSMSGQHSSSYAFTSWHADLIIDANQVDTIEFVYQQETHFYRNALSATKYQWLAQNCSPGSILEDEFVTTTTNSTARLLSKINYTGGEVTFIRGTLMRQDLNGGYPLEAIEVKRSDGTILSRYEFSTSYLTGSGGGNGCAPPSNQEFFYTQERRWMLLDSVNQVAGNEKLSHVFAYNRNSVPPCRLSFSQDYWGYFNDKSTNTSLVPTEWININMPGYPPVIKLEGADRSVNPVHTQFGMLTRITYPTGGFSEFTYENHEVDDAAVPKALVYATASLEPEETITTNQYNTTFQIDNPSYLYLNGNHPQGGAYVDIYADYFGCDISGGAGPCANVFIQGTSPGNSSVYVQITGNQSNVHLPNGDYLLKAIFQQDPPMYGNFFTTVIWQELDSTRINQYAGGLRIKQIKTSNGVSALNDQITKYKYTKVLDSDSSSGSVLGNQFFLYKELVQHRVSDWVGGSAWCETCTAYYIRVKSYSNYNAISHSGSFVGYNTVVEDLEENGYTTYKFSFPTDIQSTVFPYPPATSFEFARGLPIEVNTFKKSGANYTKVKSVKNEYNSFFIEEYPGFSLKTGDRIIVENNCSTEYTFPEFKDYELYSAKSLLTKSKEVLYSQNDSLIKITDYLYTPERYQLSHISETDSRGINQTTILEYPADITLEGSSETAREMLLSRNVHAQVLRQEKKSGTTSLETILTDYNIHIIGNSTLVVPDKISLKIGPEPMEASVEFTHYNKSGKILTQKRSDDIETAYVWDYDDKFPIAEIINSDISRCAYTSFETSALGGWQLISSPVYSASESFTGLRSFSGTLSKVVPIGNYTVTAWSKGTVTVNSQAPVIKQSVNSWDLCEWNLTNVSSIQISGLTIDDVGLYPYNAQLRTINYQPEIGISSMTDVNNVTSYYEYDSFGRLKLIKDDKGNVLQHYTYNYKQN